MSANQVTPVFFPSFPLSSTVKLVQYNDHAPVLLEILAHMRIYRML